MPALRLGTIFLLSLGSLDNVGIDIAYGVRRLIIPFGTNLLIAGLTASGAGAWAVMQETWFRQPAKPPEELQMIAGPGGPRFFS